MKLKPELKRITELFTTHKERLMQHKAWLLYNKNYDNLEVRLAWDCLRYVNGTDYITMLYDKYEASDQHITTLGIRALKDAGIL